MRPRLAPRNDHLRSRQPLCDALHAKQSGLNESAESHAYARFCKCATSQRLSKGVEAAVSQNQRQKSRMLPPPPEFLLPLA